MRVLSWSEVDRPVDKVEVEVVKLELSECVIKSGLDMLGVMLCVPELGCDKDIFTLQARNVFEGTLDAFCDFFLVLVADWCENYQPRF